MKTPPTKLDNAEVLLWAWSESEPFFVMPDGQSGIEIYGLAICRYQETEKYYRFSCNKNWEVENDADANSIEEAMAIPSGQYDIRKIKWNKMAISKNQLMVLLDRFIKSEEPSQKLAGEIEGALVELKLDEDPRFDDLVHALASYQPGGGPYLYDKNQLLAECRHALDLVKSLND